MNNPIYTDPIDKEKSDQFILYQDFKYTLSNDIEICIPLGYRTDLASIPRLFWVIWPPHSIEYRTASLVHDYLYMEPNVIVSRAFADAEFKRILISNGTNKITANIFYVAVRIMGWLNWNKFKERKNGIKK
jgi:hypothetical protein